ncbi:MAG: FG-GAP repeat protein [Ignavibacteria bacterium]|nr:FG-GAP repeat protein [Ignavibacteria bacterium]
MKTLVLIASVALLLGFSFCETQKNEPSNIRYIDFAELQSPSAPSFAETVNNGSKKDNQESVSKDIDQGWYQKVIQNIQKEEYNITYSEELGTYQSPNRANNIRFIYHNNGFMAKTRTNKIPKFDVNDKTLREEDKEYDTIKDFEIDLRITNDELQITNNNLQAAGNKAWIENENLRIDYTNTKEGMRQDFIIKQKPLGEGKLRLDLSAKTELKMIVGADALMFKNDKGEEKMKYSALKVWDANGKPLRAYFEKKQLQNTNYNLQIEDKDKQIPNQEIPNSQFSIVVNDEDAVYPVTIDPLSTTASWTKSGTQAEEQYGFTVATAGDVNGDGYSDIAIGAPEYDNINTAGGRVHVYYGSATGPSVTPNWTKEEYCGLSLSERFGYSVATTGDVNGDGYSDLIVGALTYTTNISLTWSQGKAFVYHGSASGLSASANWSATVTVTNAWFGASVSSAGDVNGDGYSDVVVGCPFWTQFSSSTEGKAFVYHGSSSGLSSSANWSSNVGEPYNQQYASDVASAGDVNGDGYSDILVGQERYNSNIFAGYNEGRVFAYYGSSTGLSATANWTKIGPQQSFFGNSISTAGDVNGDGYSDAVIGAYQANSGQEGEGRVYVYNGSSTGLSVNPSWISESNQSYSNFGASVSTAGDVNGDGYGDIIASANFYDNGQNDEGAVFGWFGSSTGLGANGTPANADWTIESNEDTAYLGECVATAGDVNGDGYSDVIISSDQMISNGSQREGKVALYTGSASGLATQSGWSNEGGQDNAFYGQSVASAGDVNGDGYSDVIVGAYLYDNGQTDEGRVYIYHGSATGLNPTANTISESNSANAQFGYSVSTAGDVNGDGFSDVLVGGPNWAGQGRVYVFNGSLAGINALWNYNLFGDSSGEFFGCAVSTAGDVNGDGYSDVIIGAENAANGQTQEGRAYIFNGSTTGLNTSYSWVSEVNQANARYGHSVSTAGDVNGDGYSDVVVGAWTYDNGQNDEGAAWIYYGSMTGISGSSQLEINLASANFGSSVASAGDVNGDGFSDVIIGASSYSNPEFLEGAAFVYNGSSSGINTTPSWQTQSNQTLTNLGISVAGAGDVNGDGYSDVIVGAFNFENGQTDEGKIQVHHGSQTGLSTTASWTIESNTANANLGVSVASAGDVNGDGYSDVIVGAYRFANGNTGEGKAFVYYGGGGGGNARANVQQYSPALVLL